MFAVESRSLTMGDHSRLFGIALVSFCVVSCVDKAGETTETTSSTTAGPSTGGETTVEHTTNATQGESENSSGSAEPTTDEPTTDEPTTDEPTTDEPTTDEPTTSSGETCDFLDCDYPDLPAIQECNTYEEDCPEGQKCMPWANDGGNAWNALKCVNVTGEGLHGDPCTVEVDAVSGMDDCALHHMCWEVDLDTNMGHCISFCDGTPNDATCDEPDTVCIMTNQNTLNICLPACNPLLQDCPEGEGCYPVNHNYACAPVGVPDEVGFEGDTCEYVVACQPGFSCMDAEQVPNCMSPSCCTPFCDLTEQDPCPNPETQCIPVYEDNQNAPNVGFCGVP